jgi:pyruvate formate lyase activating enzyme
VYGRVCAAHIDPVEKKPLFHYLPGSVAFSVATAGCNVNCKFCQNWELSQASPEEAPGEFMPPARVVELARLYNCPTIAFTYTEPIVASEFVMDTADRAHEQGIRTIEISNGYIHKDAIEPVYGRMDAVKIDLKAFSESYYRKVVVGELKPVLDTLVALVKLGKWTEIVYLLVPTMNDSDQELTDLARWIKAHLGRSVPLHFSQFHPDYKMLDLPITSVSSLERAKRIADAEGLQFVYIGNVPGHPAESTYCPHCSRILIHRIAYDIRQMLICDGACPYCRQIIPGIWSA